MHAGLRDAAQFVFDRVFDGNDVFGFVARRRQSRIKRGGFARTGRAGHQNHAVRARQHRVKPFLVFGRKAQFAQIGDQRRVIEQTHHDFFAVKVGQSRNAKIESARAIFSAETSVLRQTFAR